MKGDDEVFVLSEAAISSNTNCTNEMSVQCQCTDCNCPDCDCSCGDY
jgi:hypothetical protein